MISVIIEALAKARDYGPHLAVQESEIQDRAQGHTANEGTAGIPTQACQLLTRLVSTGLSLPHRVTREPFSLRIKARAPGTGIFSSLGGFHGG